MKINAIRKAVSDQLVRLEKDEYFQEEEQFEYKYFKDCLGRNVIIRHRYTPLVNDKGERLKPIYPKENDMGITNEPYIKVALPVNRGVQVRLHVLLAYMKYNESAFGDLVTNTRYGVDHINNDQYDNTWFNLEPKTQAKNIEKDGRLADHLFALYREGKYFGALNDWKYVESLIEKYPDIKVWQARSRIVRNTVKVRLV